MDRASRVVVALGGNALQEAGAPPTAEAQLEVVRKTAGFLAEISTKGYEMAIVHGNGPQVGRIVLSQEIASRENPQTPAMPFDVCGAMSQGYIGYHIQQALSEALRDRGREIPVVTLVTQVVVDPGDPAFSNPTKPIGPFYTEDEAKAIAEERGFTMKEDAGRGWRRVVPSPDPKRIVELSAVKRLWDTSIVITAGGGGIPVVEKGDGSLAGVAAVIDKDLAAGRLAQDIEADILLILTEVDKVCLNYKKPGQRFLDGMTVSEAERFMEEGHFAPGSMLPKVLASVKFARSSPGRKAVITSLFKAVEALEGREGTVVTMD
ncbi:MAG: Carbamate kinase 1 [Synergistetes bacterium ADurb.Bin155]|jgi:carbamate kinase|nr:carbamate kinase [Synergistales bacterium]NMD17874.1 carbamate kinase [Synergistaceae bacterium]OQB46187.1 MAG: Carbamate kinase 1 [Synergistetes bacterium ADurb.Bin155]MBP8995271.1 carbamate kinase [Synergistales bacterium]HOC81690.1 carbamate kinase [Synergistales bacterium]